MYRITFGMFVQHSALWCCSSYGKMIGSFRNSFPSRAIGKQSNTGLKHRCVIPLNEEERFSCEWILFFVFRATMGEHKTLFDRALYPLFSVDEIFNRWKGAGGNVEIAKGKAAETMRNYLKFFNNIQMLSTGEQYIFKQDTNFSKFSGRSVLVTRHFCFAKERRKAAWLARRHIIY